MSWGISPPPPLPCSLNPNPRVVMIEDCGKIILFGGGGGPVFKFWLWSLPAVCAWARDLICLCPHFWHL